MTYVNISGYCFIDLTELEDLQQSLKRLCLNLCIKGTILLSHEGINVFVCGQRHAIDKFTQALPSFGLPLLTFKESPSQTIPFKRILVKIKDEIISMGSPEIRPSKNPAPYVSAQQLKQWLDEKRDIVILDTRNTYEIEIGKFKKAIDVNIRDFRSFPDAVKKLPNELKEKTIVTYCTGGIRCEKAAPFLMAQGFKEVYQLDGGILKYFEENGSAHYQGQCFVFDNRIAVDSNLNEIPMTENGS